MKICSRLNMIFFRGLTVDLFLSSFPLSKGRQTPLLKSKNVTVSKKVIDSSFESVEFPVFTADF